MSLHEFNRQFYPYQAVRKQWSGCQWIRLKLKNLIVADYQVFDDRLPVLLLQDVRLD